jgi:hypothetical protein
MSSLVNQVQQNVLKFLSDEFGAIEPETNGWINIPFQSTLLTISCHEFGDSVLVRTSAIINRNCKTRREIYEWLAAKNLDMVFGCIIHTNTSSGTLTAVQSNLLGDNLHADELFTIMSSAANVADSLDEEFQARFGGKRFID